MRQGPGGALGREKIRFLNQSAIINAIHRSGRISRTEIAAQLHLSPAAVTNITAPFVEEGLVVEAEVGESTSVGRKPILLGINYDYAHVFGVKVMPDAIVASLTNLNADAKGVLRYPLADTTTTTLATSIREALDRLVASTGVPEAAVAGLGVSLPGVVDHVTGYVRHSDILGWRHVGLADLLRDEVGLPTLVENDVNALAAAHGWFGLGRDHDSFLTVTLGRGVGLGIVIGGNLYRGPRGGAGELGHTRCPVIEPRAMTLAGGSLEATLSDRALLEQAKRLAPGHGPLTDPNELTGLAEAGHEGALDLLADAGELLGVALSDLVNLFAPTLIILGGEGLRNAPYFLPHVGPALERHAFGGLADGLDLHVDTWGDDAWARGAAGLAAARFLQVATVPLQVSRLHMGSA